MVAIMAMATMAVVLRCLDHRFGLRSAMGSIAGSADDDQTRHCGGWVAPEKTVGFLGDFSAVKMEKKVQ